MALHDDRSRADPEVGRNLEAYRSEQTYGPTDAHTVLVVRVAVVGLRARRRARDVAPSGRHRGAPGVRSDSLRTTEDGERQRTLTLLG